MTPSPDLRDLVADLRERLATARLVTAVEDGFIIPEVGQLQDYLDFLDVKEKFGVHGDSA